MSLQTDIKPPLVSTILNYLLDVHELFFILLIIYTQGHKVFPDVAERYRIQDRIEDRSTLTTLGVMLMESLSISSNSVREFLRGIPRITDSLVKPLVEFEYVTRGGGVRIDSLDRIGRIDRQHYHVFDVIDPQLAFRPYMRGIGINLQLGDRVYRAQDSEVGIALRRAHEYDEPVAWVIVGEGKDWTPDEATWARLELLQCGRLPDPADLTFPTQGNHGGRLALLITIDWYVAMSIVDGLSEMSWDHGKPGERSPSVPRSNARC